MVISQQGSVAVLRPSVTTLRLELSRQPAVVVTVLTATNGTQLRVLLMEQRIQPMLRAISLQRRVTIAPSPADRVER